MSTMQTRTVSMLPDPTAVANSSNLKLPAIARPLACGLVAPTHHRRLRRSCRAVPPRTREPARHGTQKKSHPRLSTGRSGAVARVGRTRTGRALRLAQTAAAASGSAAQCAWLLSRKAEPIGSNSSSGLLPPGLARVVLQPAGRGRKPHNEVDGTGLVGIVEDPVQPIAGR